jgi:hypothetical protein
MNIKQKGKPRNKEILTTASVYKIMEAFFCLVSVYKKKSGNILLAARTNK